MRRGHVQDDVGGPESTRGSGDFTHSSGFDVPHSFGSEVVYEGRVSSQ